MPHFTTEHDPVNNRALLRIRIGDKYVFEILRTENGVIADLYPKGSVTPVGSIVVRDQDLEPTPA